MRQYVKDEKQLTFRNGKESDGYDRVPMGTSDRIMGVANGQIKWMVLYMSSCH